jgi:DNA-binding response OmpR family regulator
MLSLKLLVVEDDIACLELMTEVLKSQEAEVHPISDSREAATAINNKKFDGIFLDLEMPNLHGFSLTRSVRASSWNKTTPIVIVTGREERDTMQEAFATGATFFLQKPVDRNKLIRLFRTVRGTMSDNRRRYVRVPLQTDVTCQIESRTLYGRTWNLSQGGTQVEVDNLKPGESIRVSFRLPVSAVLVEAGGIVVWTKEGRQGIQFTKLTSQHRAEILDFIGQVEYL